MNPDFLASILAGSIAGIFSPRVGFALVAAFIVFDIISGKY